MQSFPGWAAKRVEATAAEKLQSKEKRQGKVFFVQTFFKGGGDLLLRALSFRLCEPSLHSHDTATLQSAASPYHPFQILVMRPSVAQAIRTSQL